MARFKWTRDFFVPREHDEKIEDTDLGIEIYLYKVGEKHAAVGFGGKRQKPDFHYTFRDEERRQQHIENYLKGQQEHKQYMAKKKRERTSYEHDFKVGDILYCTWGYEQTNVDFYQVIDTTKKMVTIHKIHGKIVEEDGARMWSGTCVADKDNFVDNDKWPQQKLVQPSKYGAFVTIASYASASKWNGQPVYFSNDY